MIITIIKDQNFIAPFKSLLKNVNLLNNHIKNSINLIDNNVKDNNFIDYYQLSRKTLSWIRFKVVPTDMPLESETKCFETGERL